MSELKEKLIDRLVAQFKEDLANGDSTVLDELLGYAPIENLIAALPEEEWGEFEELRPTEHSIVEGAKKVLEERGYYCGNLWSVEDVQSIFECTNDEAYEVLDGALQNEATMEQIWFAIRFHGEDENLTEKDEE